MGSVKSASLFPLNFLAGSVLIVKRRESGGQPLCWVSTIQVTSLQQVDSYMCDNCHIQYFREPFRDREISIGRSEFLPDACSTWLPTNVQV